jgi:hypothetical protein
VTGLPSVRAPTSALLALAPSFNSAHLPGNLTALLYCLLGSVAAPARRFVFET